MEELVSLAYPKGKIGEFPLLIRGLYNYNVLN